MQNTTVIKSRRYEVLAICIEDGNGNIIETPAIDFLMAECLQGKNNQPFKGFSELFDRYSEDELQSLTKSSFHLADNDEKIFEFIKGPYRIFCFRDGNKVILTNGARKKTQKAAPRDIGKAITYKNNYFNN